LCQFDNPGKEGFPLNEDRRKEEEIVQKSNRQIKNTCCWDIGKWRLYYT
jgi:hypothetical protein